MMKYLIINTGCHDETIGMDELTEDAFHFLKNLFDKLNENSIYDCQPKIVIVPAPNLKEVEKNYQEKTGDNSHAIRRINGRYYICDDLP